MPLAPRLFLLISLALAASYGRGWAVKPVGPDKRRVLMYYVGSKGSFVESSPVKTFVKAFAYEYQKANGIDD